MTFCLESTIIQPEKNNDIKNIVVLLHGYGGDGKDISMLTLNWQRFMPNTIFICPNGHEPCAINPLGYQWFDLRNDDPNHILNEFLKAEKKINKFLDEIKSEYKVDNNKIILGAIGVLQFEVVSFRLQNEYQVECIYEEVNLFSVRWITCDDSTMLAEFKNQYRANLAVDQDSYLVYLAPSRVNLQLAQEKWPEVNFATTREH